MLAKGDWSPGENTKKYIQNPASNLNNVRYMKLFAKENKRQSIKMSNCNSATDIHRGSLD